MENIIYDKLAFDTIKNLKSITNDITLQKEGDNVALHQKSSTEIYIDLTFPKKMFDFVGDTLCIVDYSSFYSLFSFFSKALLKQDEKYIYIKSGKSEVKYRHSNPEFAKSSTHDNSFDFVESLFVKLEMEDFADMVDMIGKIGAKLVKVDAKEKSIIFKAINDHAEHSFNMEFVMDDAVKAPISATFNIDIFKAIPKAAYRIALSEVGDGMMINFRSENNGILFNAYTGEKE